VARNNKPKDRKEQLHACSVHRLTT